MNINYTGNIPNVDIHWPTPKIHENKIGAEVLLSNTYEDTAIIPCKAHISPEQEYISVTSEIEYGICKDRCVLNTLK